MDGFMAAVACSHEPISPSKMLENVWGEEQLENVKQAQKIPALIFQHWDDTRHLLASKDAYEPLLIEINKDAPLARQWARGFVLGIDLQKQVWKDVFKDENLASWLIALCLLADVVMPEFKEKLQGLDPGDHDREELLEVLLHGVDIYYAYFKQCSRTNQAPDTKQ